MVGLIIRRSWVRAPPAPPSESPNLGRYWAQRPALAEGFADGALGEFVLAYDALGVNPEHHVDAMRGPLGGALQSCPAWSGAYQEDGQA
jgi:hypothetical protein